MELFNELNNLILKYRFYPKKGSGIHFIIKKNLIQEMLSLSELKKSDKVLEIFAGEFFLARALSEKTSLTLIEERKNLFPVIKGELPKTKLISSLDSKFNSKKCVSFLPSDNSETFFNLLFFDFELMVLLLQKDFVEKILAEPGFTEYSFFTVLTDVFFEVKEVVEVKPNNFFPPASCDYSIVKLKKKKNKIKNKKDFFEFVKALFRFKNRVFVSALIKALPLMKLNSKIKDKIKKKISEIEFNEKIYLMESEDFIELFKLLIK